jgi:capsular exopolysaccharide synthesis family protein
MIDLSRAVRILNHRRDLILGSTAFCLALAVLYLKLATPTYEATATLELHTRRPRIVNQEEALIVDDGGFRALPSDALNTQFHKIQGDAVRTRAVTDLRKVAAGFPEISDYTAEDMGNFVENVVELEQIRGTYLVKIFASAPSAALAVTVANIYADASVEVVKDSTRSASQSAVAWLQEQIATYEKEILENEAKVIAFRQKHNLEGLKSAKASADQALVALNDELIKHQTRATVLRDTAKTLDEIRASPEAAGELPTTIARVGVIEQTLQEYTDQLEELKLLLDRFTPAHPKVQSLQRSVDALQKRIEVEIGRAKETTKAELALTEAYVRSITSNKTDQLRIADELQQQMNRLNTAIIPLERALEASDVSYKGLLARIEQARMSTDEDTSVVTLYEAAKPPTDPVRPDKLIVLAIAIIGGLGVGILLAWAVHLLRDRIYGLHDIELDLGLNLLGVLPHVAGQPGTEETATISLRDRFAPVSESVSAVRAALAAQGHRRDGQAWVVLVSSATAGEGKTSVSCNLAVSMSRTMGKVLLIDGDMRRPRLHRVFNLEVKEGETMAHVMLREDADSNAFAAIPLPTSEPNLWVAPGCVDHAVNPVEILGTRTFRRFLLWAQENFDAIVVDSAPLGLLSDAFSFAQVADDLVWVSRYNVTRKGTLRHAARDLAKHRCPMTGVVLNDFQTSPLGQGYGYGRYKYHYYYYGRPYGAGQDRAARGRRKRGPAAPHEHPRSPSPASSAATAASRPV